MPCALNIVKPTNFTVLEQCRAHLILNCGNGREIITGNVLYVIEKNMADEWQHNYHLHELWYPVHVHGWFIILWGKKGGGGGGGSGIRS